MWTFKNLLFPDVCCFKMGLMSLSSIISIWLVLFLVGVFSSSVAVYVTGQSYIQVKRLIVNFYSSGYS